MALTSTEEALVRQLLDQQAAILSLAGNEATITSKLGATKVTLADLIAASSVNSADLLLLRQGTSDKSVTIQKLLDSANFSFLQDGTGAVSRSVSSKLRERISVKDFGAVGNGTADDTEEVQAASNYAASIGACLFFPEGTYRLTAPLTVVRGVTFEGVHPVVKAPGGADFGGGTWLYFDHTGRGITAINSGGYFTDVVLRELGTRRNQPVPAPGWAPNNHDFDLYCFGIADIILHNVTMLNPTKAVGIFGDPANGPGRLEIFNFRCQAFKQGIVIDTTYDVTRLDHIHFWPFWRDSMDVHTYTMGNLDAIYSLRNDNPMMSNIFTIFARAGLRVGQGANGGTSKIHLVNADLDRGTYGIWVDNTVTSGCTGQFANITHQGETGFAGSKGLFVQGNNSTLSFSSFESGYAHQNAVRIEGTGNVVTFGDARAVNYDQSAGNFPAFEALTGNFMSFATRPKAINGGGAGGKFGTTGTIVCDEWRSFTPVVSSQLGVITTIGAKSGRYKVVGNTVHVEVDFVITTNGTGSGDLRVDLPFGAGVRNFSGVGRELNVAGKGLIFVVRAGTTQCLIYNYDNTYPGVDNGRYIGKFEYDIEVGI